MRRYLQLYPLVTRDLATQISALVPCPAALPLAVAVTDTGSQPPNFLSPGAGMPFAETGEGFSGFSSGKKIPTDLVILLPESEVEEPRISQI